MMTNETEDFTIIDCCTDETEILEIECEKLIRYQQDKEEELDLLAQYISQETNVPKSSIFTGEFNCRIENWHKINGEYYYFKPMHDSLSFFNELLGEVISQYFELDTVHYKIAKLKVKGEEEQYGIASRNFCNPKYTYKALIDYVCETDSLHIFEKDLRILDKIKVICKSEGEFRLLQDDLKKMFIRHFYNAQGDGGNGQNIFLMSTPNGIRLAPLLDYEMAYIGYADLHRCFWDIGELDVTNPRTIHLFRNDIRFQELLYKLMDANMNQFISEIEDSFKIKVPMEDKSHYIKYEARIKELVLENNLIRKKVS